MLDKTLRVPWTARRSNQSTLKEVSPKYSLEGLMLKLQYFGHLMQRANSLEKTLMLGKIEGKRRRGQQRMRWLDGITDEFEQAPGDSEGQGSLACCSPWGWRVGHDLAIEQHIYTESRKMVLMYLFAGQEWRRRGSEQTCEHWAGRRGWEKLRVALTYIHFHVQDSELGKPL